MRPDSYTPPPVIPAEAGIQRVCNYLKTLDSHSPIRSRTGFMGMTKKIRNDIKNLLKEVGSML